MPLSFATYIKHSLFIRTLTRQIDDIREGRWDEDIAKELGIHPETGGTKPEDVMLVETVDETPSDQSEQVVPSAPEEEVRTHLYAYIRSLSRLQSMDISEEPMAPMTSIGEQQEEVVALNPELPAEIQLTPTVDIPEKEPPIIDEIPPSPSQVEDVGSALEEIKISAAPDESDVHDATPVTPSGKGLPFVHGFQN